MTRKRMIGLFVICCILCALTRPLPTYAEDNHILIADFGTYNEASKKADTSSDLSVSTAIKYLNSGTSLKWEFTDYASYVETMQTPQRDLSEYGNFRMRYYSENANDQFVVLATYNKDTGIANNPYFYCIVTTKGTGWEEITLSQRDFAAGSARPTVPGGSNVEPSWSEVGGIYLQTTGWGSTTVKGHCIYIDKIWLEKIGQYGPGSIPNIYSKEVVEKAKNALNGGGAAYAESPSVVTDENVYTFKADDKSVKAISYDGTLMIPVSFFKDFIGCTIREENDAVSIKYNNIQLNAETGKSRYNVNGCYETYKYKPFKENDCMYISAAETAKALGLYVVKRRNFVAISCNNDIQLLECENGVNEYLEVIEYIAAYREIDYSLLTNDECKKVKDIWRHQIVGSAEDNDPLDAYIGKKLVSLSYVGKHDWDDMIKGSEQSLFSSVTVTTTADMTSLYSKLYNMMLAYGTYNSLYYKDSKLGEDIKYGLDWMYNHLYGEAELLGNGWRSTSDFNWWDWDIGSPQYLIPILLVMEEELSAEEINNYLKLFDYLVPEPLDYGSNAVITGKLAIGSALLKNNGRRIIELQQKIDSTFLYADNGRNAGEGFYTDGSYVFHYKHPMNGTYGIEQLRAVGLLLNKFEGTAFEITNPHADNIIDWISDSFMPLIYEGGVFRMVKGRYPTGQHTAGKDAIGAMLNILYISSESEQQFIKEYIKSTVKSETIEDYTMGLSLYDTIKLSEILSDESVSAQCVNTGNHVYYNEDKVVHRRENFAIGISMSSSRIFNYESINGCNLNGWYISDGMTEYYVAGEQLQSTDDYWNNVNPYKLPGTTVDSQTREKVSINNNEAYLSSKDFVGGVSNSGLYGIAAMDLESYHKETASGSADMGYGGSAPVHICNLEAQKSYFMFDDEMVCLGNGISSSDNSEVITVVDNKLSKAVSEGFGTDKFVFNGRETPLTDLNKKLKNPKYAHYENVGGYFFPDGGELYARQKDRFMELWFSHGNNPDNATYAYALLPSMTASEAKAYSENPDIEILSNTSNIQAVRENTLGITGYVFREAASFENVSVDQPMLVMLREENNQLTISVADPTHKLSKAVLTLGTSTVTDRCDSKMSISGNKETVIEIDFENSNGRTLEAVLEKNNELTATTPILYDFSGNVIFDSGASNISRIETTLQNCTDSDTEVYFIFAQYNEFNELLDCDVVEKTVKSGEINSVDIDGITIDVNSFRNDIFIWDKKSLLPVRIKK